MGPKLPFNFAYPNLYLVTDAGESVLLAHGHYFEAYWSLGSDWVVRLAGDDLGLREGELSLQDMVGMNLPLNQLACTGIGQSHPLTRVARAVQRETTAGRTDRLAKYLDRLERALRAGARRSLPVRIAHGWALSWLRRRFLRSVAMLETSRYSADFTQRPSVRQRFRSYYRQSLRELRRLDEAYGVKAPEPTHVVFGHTHQPIPWGSEELIDVVELTAPPRREPRRESPCALAGRRRRVRPRFVSAVCAAADAAATARSAEGARRRADRVRVQRQHPLRHRPRRPAPRLFSRLAALRGVKLRVAQQAVHGRRAILPVQAGHDPAPAPPITSRIPIAPTATTGVSAAIASVTTRPCVSLTSVECVSRRSGPGRLRAGA